MVRAEPLLMDPQKPLGGEMRIIIRELSDVTHNSAASTSTRSARGTAAQRAKMQATPIEAVRDTA